MFRLRTLSTVCRVGVSALKVAIAPKKIENAGKLIPCRRHLSTTDNTEKEKQNADHKIKKLDYDEYDEYEFEEPKTAGQKVQPSTKRTTRKPKRNIIIEVA